MILVLRKHVFVVSEKVIHNVACSALENSQMQKQRHRLAAQ